MKCAFIIFSLIITVMVYPVHDASALCIKTAEANIRSGPGTEYEILWQAYRFMPVQHIGTSPSGSWYAVRDVDGDVGWIYKALVTGRYRCAVVKSQIVNVRKGPGTKYGKVFSEPAKRYDTFRIIKQKGVWVKVRDEWNSVGWIHKNYLWIR